MITPINYSADFYEDGLYHVYNRTNNKELLFKSTENKIFFLKQYKKYLNPFVDTFCWNLLSTHFHFLVQIKPVEQIKKYLETISFSDLKPIEKKFLADQCDLSLLIVLEWKRFFNSYAMAFNKQYKRHGNLFKRPFKRVEIIKESHFTQTVIYIHANAQYHKLCNDFTLYPWSSYHTILSDKPTDLKRDDLLEWFGGKQQFIEIHKSMVEYYTHNHFSTDDED